VSELVTGVNIALGRRDVTDCPSFDLDGDSLVRVNELIRGVRSALDGCEAVETPTGVGATDTPAAATETPTSGATETPEITVTAEPTETPTAGETPTAEETSSPAATVSATVTPAETETPVIGATETPTAEDTSTPDATVSATVTPNLTATAESTATPTGTLAATTTPPEASVTATQAPTLTPTGLPTGTSTLIVPPSATPTPTGVMIETPAIEKVAGGSVVVANALGGIANVVAAAVTGVSGGGGAVLLGIADLDFCELGGMIESVGNLPSDVSITLTDCAVSRPSGTAVYDGTIALTDVMIDSLVPPRLSASAAFSVTTELKDITDTTTLTTKSDISATVLLTGQIASEEICAFPVMIEDAVFEIQLVGLELTLDGDIESSTVAGGASLSFNETKAEFAIDGYQSDCAPISYVLKLEGEATAAPVFPLATSGGGGFLGFALEFVDYTLQAIRDGESTDYEIDGGIDSPCFGSADLDTLVALRLADEDLCPSQGQIAVAGVGVITYADGGVSIDAFDPETAPDEYLSCLDLALLICPE